MHFTKEKDVRQCTFGAGWRDPDSIHLINNKIRWTDCNTSGKLDNSLMVRKCFDNLEKHIKQEKEMDELAQDTREFFKVL